MTLETKKVEELLEKAQPLEVPDLLMEKMRADIRILEKMEDTATGSQKQIGFRLLNGGIWNKKYYAIAVSTFILVCAIAGMIVLSPSISGLAEVLETTLHSPFHAVHSVPGAGMSQQIQWEVYYQYPRAVEIKKGEVTKYNDGKKTWLLDQVPPLVREESPHVMFARRIGLADLILDTPPKEAQRRQEIQSIPDSIVDGIPVRIWRVLWYSPEMDEPVQIKEYSAEKGTHRIVWIKTWFADFFDNDSDGDTQELFLMGTTRFFYEKINSDEVFRVQLPALDQVRDLGVTQKQLQVSPSIIVFENQDLKVEIKYLQIGPGGEVILCQRIISLNSENPPTFKLNLTGLDGIHYKSASLGNELSPRESTRVSWFCFFPLDFDRYLAGLKSTNQSTLKIYKLKYWNKEPSLQREIEIQPQVVLAQSDYQKKVVDPILASGIDLNWKLRTYPGLLQEIARMGAIRSTSCYLGKNLGKNQVEGFFHWLLRFRDLAIANERPDDFTRSVRSTILHKFDKAYEVSTFYKIIQEPTHRILGAHRTGQSLELEDFPFEWTESSGPWQGSPISGRYFVGEEEIKVYESFEGPMGEIVLGVGGAPRLVDCFRVLSYRNRAYAASAIVDVTEGGKRWRVFAPVTLFSPDWSHPGFDVQGLTLALKLPEEEGGKRFVFIPQYTFTPPLLTAEEMDIWLHNSSGSSFGLDSSQLKERILEEQILGSYCGSASPDRRGLKVYDLSMLWKEYTNLVRMNETQDDVVNGYSIMRTRLKDSLLKDKRDQVDVEGALRQFAEDFEIFRTEITQK